MRDIPSPTRSYDWTRMPGIVYLMRCSTTGEYKVGATINPRTRLSQLCSLARDQYGRHLVHQWSIVTNGIGRLESYWVARWKPYAVPLGREWFAPPEHEALLFRSTACLTWADLPPVKAELREALSGLYVYRTAAQRIAEWKRRREERIR